MLMLFSALFAVGCFWAQRRIVGSSWTTRMTSWFLFLFFVMNFIGLHILSAIDGVAIPGRLFFVLYLLPVTLIISVLLIGNRGKRIWANDSLDAASVYSTKMSVYLFLFAAFMLLFYYIIKMPRIPLFLAIMGSDEVGDARAEAMIWGGNAAFKYAFLVLVRYLVPFLAIYVYVCHRRGANLFSEFTTRMLLVCAYLILLMEGQKAQIVFFSVQLFVANRLTITMNRDGGKKTTKSWTYAVVSLLSLMIAFEILIIIYFSFMKSAQAGGVSLWEAHGTVVEAILRRVTINQATPLLEIFNSFPSKHPYLLGRTFPFSEFIGLGSRFEISEYTYRLLYGNSAAVGAASSLFVSEFYANFGMIGAVTSILFVVPAIAIADKVLYHKIHSYEGVVVYSFLLGYVMRLAITQVVMGLALPILSVMLFLGVKRLFYSFGRKAV